MNRKIFTVVLSIFIGINVFGQANIKADKLKSHVYFLASDSLEGRGLSTKSGHKAANYVADHFRQIGLQAIGDSYFHPFFARIGQTMLEGKNVVGLIEGSDPELKSEYIVLGAHFDHISYKIVNGEKVVYNGADDNASGTAAVIELGRALMRQKDKLKRSVVLVGFDAEESGLIGSRSFVRNNTVPMDQVKVMMSIDMIGRYAESNYLVMGAMESLKQGQEKLFKVTDNYDIKIKGINNEISNRTDSKSFGDAGIPSIYVSSGIVGPYHKPEDDPETIDYAGMELISNLLLDLTLELAGDEELIPNKKTTAGAESKGLPFFRLGVKGNIGGSSHIYPNEFYKGKSRFSSELGLMSQFRISKNFSLQPELLYSTMAAKSKSGNFRTHSITMPMSLVIASNIDRNVSQRFYATIGAYYSYHFAGRMAKKPMDFANSYARNETGLVYGFGFEVMSVFVSVSFKHGFTNLLSDETKGVIRSRGTYLTVGYVF